MASANPYKDVSENLASTGGTLRQKKASASFVCGDLVSIDAKKAADSSISSQTIPVSPPVRVCWRTDGDNIPREVALPLGSNADSKSSPDGLHRLVVDCGPASFGRGQEDIIDLNYRKAGKLEPRHFFISFHPLDFGILQNVEQILLPNFNTVQDNSLPFRKPSAELYKLNEFTRDHLDFPGSILTRRDPQGGAFGFYCSHAYPHISDEAPVLLPKAFKGADLVLYSVFKSLGIRIDIVPVIIEEDYYGYEREKVRVGDELRSYTITELVEGEEDGNPIEESWEGRLQSRNHMGQLSESQ
ncbi:Oxoglutarate/iron-dependent dioxygenase [Penicillium fimorum]|uniref:Oxoglutarate/iron-dependent dioxygenase n=1 Tax=Penicillium fimorum TaxID=1882269 RepID=A0A9X0C4Y8_9EURO|nr:Oxoglutarate/iron-dependent dioxygenase [Penicillium fimorum]